MKSDVLTELVPKKEVLLYCPISKLQRELYMYVLKFKQMKKQTEVRISTQTMTKLYILFISQFVDINAPRAKRKCTLKNELKENYYFPKNTSTCEVCLCLFSDLFTPLCQ